MQPTTQYALEIMFSMPQRNMLIFICAKKSKAHIELGKPKIRSSFHEDNDKPCQMLELEQRSSNLGLQKT